MVALAFPQPEENAGNHAGNGMPSPPALSVSTASASLPVYPLFHQREVLVTRPYKPWYRQATNTWYVEISGKQNPLGKHPEGLPPPKKGKNGWVPPPEIMTAFHRLMASDPANLARPQEIKVCQVCDLFLDWSEKTPQAGNV
jgi:hypothetical protein